MNIACTSTKKIVYLNYLKFSGYFYQIQILGNVFIQSYWTRKNLFVTNRYKNLLKIK